MHCRNPAVGYDADEGGHENGYKTLHGVEPEYIFAETVGAEEHTHRNQICAPYGELEEVHRGEPCFKIEVFHYAYRLNFRVFFSFLALENGAYPFGFLIFLTVYQLREGLFELLD